MTNAERFRSSITDDEIADWILSTTICPCVAKKDGCGFDDDTCKQAWIEWLKEEVII